METFEKNEEDNDCAKCRKLLEETFEIIKAQDTSRIPDLMKKYYKHFEG